ncbi:MAG: ATP-binding cassette domain-containing protein [Acidobacteria bacterium]|nr:ATP-binding cassette domain-containing protein [Acidobacteriota bacterium]
MTGAAGDPREPAHDEALLVSIEIDRGAESPAAWPGTPITVRRGELAVITGPAGCGKSHLLRGAAGLALGSGRRALISHHELGTMTHRRRRETIAGVRLFYLPQDPPLVSNLTVLENLLLPIRYLGERDEAGAMAEARRWLEASGIAWAAASLPARLSDENRRTTALLRGFLRRPSIALLDDPLLGLDDDRRAAVLPLIRAALVETRCAILATSSSLDGLETLSPQEIRMPARHAPGASAGALA